MMIVSGEDDEGGDWLCSSSLEVGGDCGRTGVGDEKRRNDALVKIIDLECSSRLRSPIFSVSESLGELSINRSTNLGKFSRVASLVRKMCVALATAFQRHPAVPATIESLCAHPTVLIQKCPTIYAIPAATSWTDTYAFGAGHSYRVLLYLGGGLVDFTL
jgi:hypothetical protein